MLKAAQATVAENVGCNSQPALLKQRHAHKVKTEMSWTIDPKELAKKQYRDDKNLEKRIAIHKYSVCKQTWIDFIASNIVIESTNTILDVGCGNARLWDVLLKDKKQIKRLVLSDISDGMLKKANETISKLNVQFVVEFNVIDVVNIPFPDETFDVVIANHMLYHSSNVNNALSEIARVLKRNGRFYATTIGKRHMLEINEIIKGFNPDFRFESIELARRFGLDNGAELVTKHIGYGDCALYEDYLLVPNASPIVEWICSMDNEGILDDVKLHEFLINNYDFTSGFRITKETGIIKGIKQK